MSLSVFVELRFWVLVAFSLVLPAGIYGLLLATRSISRVAVLGFGVALVLIAAFALLHGYPHGVLAPRASDPAAFTVGFVVSTGVIHIIGIAIGAALKPIGGGRLVQALGAAISLAGLWFLFGLLAG